MPAHDPTADFDPNRATADPPPADHATAPHSPADAPAPLPDIPGYAVEAEIARGGMGVVYRARHLRLNRPAAIKMILGGRYHDPTARVRFLIEAEAVAALDHPHVVHVHEFGTHDGLPFFALEFVAGGTLADRLKAGKPAPRDAAALVAKLADGVAAAHARGIVHRDLKPANVLLTEAGEPKVTDFGLAKVGGADVTATGAVMGTPCYMAPEQAAGRTKDIGTAADVYALGAILYELLVDRPPFLADSAMATIQDVLTKEPVRPRALDRAVPRDLETICLKCLEKEPAKRYATVAELRADLLAYLGGRPIAARPVGAAERVWKWTKRNPGRAAAVVVSVLVVAGAVAAGFVVQQKLADQRLTAEKQRQDDADEARKRERAQKAEALVQALAVAEPGAVRVLLADLAGYRDLADEHLRTLAARPQGDPAGLRARLFLFVHRKSDPAGVNPVTRKSLALDMLTCPIEELPFFRDYGGFMLLSYLQGFASSAAENLADKLAVSADATLLRRAVMLAWADPDDELWKAISGVVTARLVRLNPLEAEPLVRAIRPARHRLVAPLMEQYAESRARIESGKLSVSELAAEASAFDLTANILSRYTTDRPADLAELAVTLDPRHFPLVAAALKTHAGAVVPRLAAELARPTAPKWATDGAALPLAAVAGCAAPGEWLDPDAALAARGKRKGHAAAALVALGEGETAWSQFRFPADGDPTARSYLIQRLAAIGADPAALVKRFEAEADVSAKRALLIALGDFPPESVPGREPFAAKLLALYRTHPDPGLHGATDWLLRQRWGKAKELEAIDADLAAAVRAKALPHGVAGPRLPAPAVAKDRDWFVNGEGQTFAVVRGPVEFTRGSPPTEPGRDAIGEQPHRKRIARTFAIAAREVTIGEFTRFEWRPALTARTGRDPDSPAPASWYDCAAYCNWLSEREGIPPSQWCYEPNTAGQYAEGMRIKTNHLELTGYRLPTEAEWEYACRSGAVTARYHGRGDELLQRYGWFVHNSERRVFPVGRLRPNDSGLFDTLGNALEWTEDPTASPHHHWQLEDTENTQFRSLDDRHLRSLRGASYLSWPVEVRCACRFGIRPSSGITNGGFRPARTLPE